MKLQVGISYKRIIGVIAILLVFAIGVLVFVRFGLTREVTGTLSAWNIGKFVWKGDIAIDHDVLVWGDVVMETGTTITVTAHVDTSGRGDEMPPDGFNDDDPTRLKAYGKKHSVVAIFGSTDIRGIREKPVILKSSDAAPSYADWEGLALLGGNSTVDYLKLYDSKYGLALEGKNNEVKNSTIVRALWGCISAGRSESFIHDNVVERCGHEGIDNQLGGSQRIENNIIKDSHGAIVVHEKEKPMTIRGNRMAQPVDVVGERAEFSNLMDESNIIDETLACDEDWVYEDYVIPCTENNGVPYRR